MSTRTAGQRRAFFEAFGFLKLPGLLRDDLPAILEDFDTVFSQSGHTHDGSRRTMTVPFIDQHPGLCALLDKPAILEAVAELIGPDFNYMSSDGNHYTGDTTWHRDGFTASNSYIKLAVYLDPVTSTTGCLRVIPGSHTDLGLEQWGDLTLRDSDNVWGVPQKGLPATPLESEPGDVLVFNHRLLHASFGGSSDRRMFTMNLGRRARTQAEIDDLIAYGDVHLFSNGMHTPYGPAMVDGATPERRVHLEQLLKFWPASVERSTARRS